MSVTFAAALLLTNGWGATHETVLHSFGNGTDGTLPYAAGLISDGAGNYYGTTVEGGIHGLGTVFELSPKEGGGWTETVLHSFGGADGASPYASLIFDAAGNLYGTTDGGGIHACNGFAHNCGTVFELSPKEGGGWTEQVLHSFGEGNDGSFPWAGLVLDGAGNLYGTTSEGGIHTCFGGEQTCGTVFELSPKEGGGWTEKVLHNFGDGNDGVDPSAGLVIDAGGNLYGTTMAGGVHGDGTVFELSPLHGGWTEGVLHSFNFNGQDGSSPYGGLVFDSAGNLYGTTNFGGIHPACLENSGCGTVFELIPVGGGEWTERVLHSFGSGTDGAEPFFTNLVFDTGGNLYGTTNIGGIHGYGTVFELVRTQGGGWADRVLHSFGSGTDGAYPFAGVVIDGAGNLYGTTQNGGIHPCAVGNCGTVFEITP